jgi:hypothetical protein
MLQGDCGSWLVAGSVSKSNSSTQAARHAVTPFPFMCEWLVHYDSWADCILLAAATTNAPHVF